MKIKVSDTTTLQLDWLVARVLYPEEAMSATHVWLPCDFLIEKYSTDWAQGGPIIEREIYELIRCQSGNTGPVYWEARAGFEFEPGHTIQTGPTPLIAAMRCFVSSRLGDEVEVPEELK